VKAGLLIFLIVISYLSQASPVDTSAQLTLNTGESSNPHFSKDGSSLFYVSKDRPLHKNQQAYEWSFVAKKERRITYSDGDVKEIISIEDGKNLAYISNTDVIKDNPELLRKTIGAAANGVSANNDIFTCDWTGLPIEKLTKSDTHYEFLSLGADGKSFVFISNKDKSSQVASMSIHGGAVTNLIHGEPFPILYPQQDSTHTVTWLEEDKSQNPSLQRKKSLGKIEVIRPPYTSIHDISWWDSSKGLLLISGKQAKDPFDNITLYDFRSQCTIPLLAKKSDLWQPTVDTEKKNLAVTTLVSGHLQIQVYSLSQDPPPSCTKPNAIPPAAESSSPKEEKPTAAPAQ
jgi:hypothetical protein